MKISLKVGIEDDEPVARSEEFAAIAVLFGWYAMLDFKIFPATNEEAPVLTFNTVEPEERITPRKTVAVFITSSDIKLLPSLFLAMT